jgi:DNA polymerase-3 subunit gamma/tau
MAKSKDTPKSASAPKPVAKPPAAPPNYTVVARRYRPQQFADLIGQEHVAAALTNAIISGRLAHAYLFTGARGTGKTSTARILAKALNCEAGPTATPCDRCDICLGIMGGDDVDVLEIDGASNNKVDEVRDLRSNVGFRPTRGRYKIYIIDEVHMLSTSAFNALLKTLEEPPPHVKFILATTEVQKIPITILSRCQRYDFATVGPAKILESLQRIVTTEKIDATDDALRIVARRANGSMRDSQTLLEQLLGACDGVLTAEKVHALFGTAPDERVGELADAILTGDVKRAVELVGANAERGLQPGELLDQLVDYWRGLMLAAVGGVDPEQIHSSPLLREAISRQVEGRNLDAVLTGIDILTATKTKMRGSPHTQVLLEVATLRLARLNDLLSVAQLAQWATGGGPTPPPASGRVPSHRPLTTAAVDPVKKKVVTAPEVKSDQPTTTTGNEDRAGESFQDVWEKVLEQVGPMLAAQLRQASNLAANFRPNSLAIQYDADYSSTYELIRGERNLDTLRRALKQVTGGEWTVRPELTAAPSANGHHRPPADATPRRRNDLMTLPFFEAAKDVLGAQLMRMDDGFDPTTATEPADQPEPAAGPDQE